jgi:D-specific alpha-keto acid dehydrogenase
MRHGAYVVNTGRGALINTEALVEALECGRLSGAALDVLEGEDELFTSDRNEGSPSGDLALRLQRLPNVLITPHTAFYTEHALIDIVHNTIGNWLRSERQQREQQN